MYIVIDEDGVEYKREFVSSETGLGWNHEEETGMDCMVVQAEWVEMEHPDLGDVSHWNINCPWDPSQDRDDLPF